VLNSIGWAALFESYDAGCSRLPFEMRHPMIDVRLVEYLLSIPPVPWCLNKEILRKAMDGKLPKVVLDRPKAPLAGYPPLCHVSESRVRFVDNFEPISILTKFVNLTARPRIAAEKDADRLAVNLRPFALNYWLMHSLAGDVSGEKKNGNHTGNRKKQP
jgi:asparagine synthase (glutamine-hydrolysing)